MRHEINIENGWLKVTKKAAKPVSKFDTTESNTTQVWEVQDSSLGDEYEVGDLLVLLSSSQPEVIKLGDETFYIINPDDVLAKVEEVSE